MVPRSFWWSRRDLNPRSLDYWIGRSSLGITFRYQLPASGSRPTSLRDDPCNAAILRFSLRSNLGHQVSRQPNCYMDCSTHEHIVARLQVGHYPLDVQWVFWR